MNDARTEDLLLKHPCSSQEGFLGRPPFEKTVRGFKLRRKCFGYTIPVTSIKVVRLPQKRVLDFPKALPLQLENPVRMARKTALISTSCSRDGDGELRT